MPKINTVLVANRGEIAIRVFRACNELGIRTVAIYSKEDTLSLHRNKADEAYLVGEGKNPTDAYLDIESIMQIAREHDVDAIHPGYGFLSENSNLARRCAEEGLIFIGPKLEHLIMFGDKINAREQAKLACIPMIPGSNGTVESLQEVVDFGEKYGYPIIIKAVNGGGGRGMRVVNNADEVATAYAMAKSEAKKAFGSDAIYIEKYLQNPEEEYSYLDEEEIEEIQKILKKGSEIDLWEIEFPDKIGKDGKKIDENELENINFFIEGTLKDLYDLQEDINDEEEKGAVERFIRKLEILKRIGVDVTKIAKRDNIKELAKKSGIDEKEIEKAGLNPGDNIGNYKHNISKSYRNVKEGKKPRRTPPTDEQI